MKKRKLIAFICIIVNILLLQAGFYIIALDETEPLGLIVSDYEIIDLQTDNAPPLQSLYDSTELQPIVASVECSTENYDYYNAGWNINTVLYNNGWGIRWDNNGSGNGTITKNGTDIGSYHSGSNYQGAHFHINSTPGVHYFVA